MGITDSIEVRMGEPVLAPPLPTSNMDLKFWGMVVWWLMMGMILAPCIILALKDIFKDPKQESTPMTSIYPPMAGKQANSKLLDDPTTGVMTPPPDVCHKAIRLLEEDLNEGLEFLSDYYGVQPPKVVINEAILEARGTEGMCSGDKIYLKWDSKIRTVLHEFLHYLINIKGKTYDKDIEEIQANRFADEICRNAYMYTQYNARINAIDYLEKRLKNWDKRLRKTLEDAFPGHPEIVEELMKDFGIDWDEEE